MTQVMTMRRFVKPASEKAWNERCNKELRWSEAWKAKSFFATPRDQLTWLKLQHRTLFTVGHMRDRDTGCRACGEKENQLHLTECGVIRAEYWNHVIARLVDMGMEEPESKRDFLITGQLSDTSTMPNEFSGVISIAWRCLYAAITTARIEGDALDLRKAYQRCIEMIVSRLHAYGETWRRWCEEGVHMSRNRVIPPKHHNKSVLFSEWSGDYCIHCALTDELGYVREQADAARANRRARPAAKPFAPEPPLRPAPAGKAPARRAAVPDDVANAEDEWRDMSGDALTVRQARERGVDAQCSLATVRNLRRQETYTRDRLAERCVHQEYVKDVRFPDWPALLQPVLKHGEVVKRANLDNVPAAELMDFRLAVIIHAGHATAVINDESDAFRYYDNDSEERRRGTYATKRADEVIDEHPGGYIIGVTLEGSDLCLRLGPETTTDRPARPRANRRPARVATTRPATTQQNLLTFFRAP